MKKKINLNRKTIRKLKLKLKPTSDRKVAPLLLNPSGGHTGSGCTSGSTCTS
ncbi:MAG TPA: hypothetical protein VND93_06955 [Myxococcales bacterium]|nr:hypothetical protein [Myxococcales bacterium]